MDVRGCSVDWISERDFVRESDRVIGPRAMEAFACASDANLPRRTPLRKGK